MQSQTILLIVASLSAASAFSFAPASPALRSSRQGVSARLPTHVTARGAPRVALRMQNEDLTDVGRRELRDLEGMWKNVCVLGGSKGVGREVVNGLVAKGVNVVALVRSEESKAELEKLSGVKVVLGDAMEASDVIGVLDGCDAAVSTLGGTTGDVRIDYKGNMNMIENAGILGVTRVVLVTSVVCGDSKEAIPDFVYESLKDALVDKTKAENLLLKYYTNTDYTIIRPGGLVTAPGTGKAILTGDKKAAGKINRADVSDMVLKALYSKKCSKMIFTAVDPSQGEGDGPVAHEI